MDRAGAINCGCDTPPQADDWLRIGLGLVISGQIMVLSLAYNISELSASTRIRLSTVLIGLTALAVALLGPELWKSTKRRIEAGSASLEAMFMLAIAGGIGASIWGLYTGGDVFFEVVTTVLVVHALGSRVESRFRSTAISKAGERLFATHSARRLTHGQVQVVDADSLLVGDLVDVPTGEQVPADGRVVSGVAWLDTSNADGGRHSRRVKAGDLVLGGTRAKWGSMTVHVTALSKESAHRRALAEFQAAWRDDHGGQAIARKLMAVFTPLIAAVSVISGLWWASQEGAGEGFRVATAVLLVACPCGLGVATPMAMWAKASSLDGQSVVIRRLRALTALAKAKTVVFDKTGTLMDLEPAITWHFEPHVDQDSLKRWVGAVEDYSDHPVANVLKAKAPGVEVRALDDLADGGLWAEICDGAQVAQITIAPSQRAGRGVDILIDGKKGASIQMEERPKHGIEQLLSGLKARNIHVEILTGDSTPAPFSAPSRTGVAAASKAQRIRALRDVSEVIFVGDAANDLPAFAAAGVGVSVQGAVPAVAASADVSIESPLGLLVAIDGARALQQRISVLIGMSIVGNVIGVSVAAAGLLHPVFAAMIMAGSSLLVTLTAISEH